MPQANQDVLIVGAGVGGLTLALQLERAGIRCRLIESVRRIEPLGVGINILPHAGRELLELGLGDALDAVGIRTRESHYYNRFGQLIHVEPVGANAGYEWPQYSIHRGDLQLVLLEAVLDRLGSDAIQFDSRLVSAEQDDSGVTVVLTTASGEETIRAGVVIGCDGVNSAVRKLLHPDLPPARYSGSTMWRGAAVWPPFLGGATMVRAGWLSTGKMVIYPIRDNVDGQGNQLVNWVAEIDVPQRSDRDWNHRGSLEDCIEPFADWHFDWLDVAALMRSTETILEYPMIDQEPLDRWSFGRISLLGDAAHPMVPRGSNGAGQAILDTRALADHLVATSDPVAALEAYDTERRVATSKVVLMNRTNPPDAILREVFERTGDQPFESIEDVISTPELDAILENYRTVAGYSLAHLSATNPDSSARRTR